MAKENVKNLIEQHVEKAVLGLCVLVLAGMYFFYARDVREIAIIGRGGAPQTAAPDGVDARLQEAAKSIEDRNRKSPAPKSEYRDHTQKVVDLQLASRIDPFGSAEARFPGKLLEVAGPIEYTKASLDDLVKKLPRPDKPLVSARAVLPQAADPRDMIVAHPASTFNWEELTKYWSSTLKDTVAAKNLRIVITEVEAEVQEKQPDGSWSAGKAIPLAATDAAGAPVTVARMPAYEPGKTDPAEISKYLSDFVKNKSQEAVVQPGFAPVWDSVNRRWSDWKNDLPQALLGDAAEPDAAAPAAPAAKPGAKPGVKPAVVAGPAIPSLSEQQQRGKLLVWFHDSSLQASRLYRYRIRLVLANPLLTYTQDVAKPADATVPVVRTPWSEWSDEVSVPRETEFFIVGSGGDRARVKIYVRSLGQRVSQTFDVAQGQSIGYLVRKNVNNPVTNKLMPRDVDFSTGVVAVEVNTAKSIQRGPVTRSTTEILYLDDKGQLKRCISIDDMDKESPEYQLYDRLEKELRLAGASAGKAP